MASLGYTAIVTMGECITVDIDGTTFHVPFDALNFDPLLACLRRRAKVEEIRPYLTPVKTIEKLVDDGRFAVIAGENGEPEVQWDGETITSKLVDLLLLHHRAGETIGPLKNFFKKAMANKSPGKVDTLFEFLTANKLPIHPDGDFFAFKAVREDGKDHHSGTVEYRIGKYVEAKDFNPSEYVQCGAGLHIGGRGYVKGFHSGRSRYFVVKVNPEDAIFFLTSEIGKMRVKKMFVYAETVGGDELMNSLAFNIIMSPEGDELQAEEERLKALRLAKFKKDWAEPGDEDYERLRSEANEAIGDDEETAQETIDAEPIDPEEDAELDPDEAEEAESLARWEEAVATDHAAIDAEDQAAIAREEVDREDARADDPSAGPMYGAGYSAPLVPATDSRFGDFQHPELTKAEGLALKAKVKGKKKGKKKQPKKTKEQAKRERLNDAKKAQSFVTVTKRTGAQDDVLKFVTKSGTFFPDAILAGVAQLGQRTYAASIGVGRTTVQEWIRVIRTGAARVR